MLFDVYKMYNESVLIDLKRDKFGLISNQIYMYLV